jgi:guanylate kinase
MSVPPRDEHHRLETDTDAGLLVIVSGPSGAGKTTITRGIERTIADSVFSVSATTRPKTKADVEGVDYHFVDDAEFDRLEREGKLLESASVFGNRYGTPRDWVDEQLRRGRLVILDIDVQGAQQVRSKMPEAFGLFILPPDEGVLLERLRARKREPEEVIQRRFAEAQREIADAKASGVYTAWVTNADVNIAIAEAVYLVQQARRVASKNPPSGAS